MYAESKQKVHDGKKKRKGMFGDKKDLIGC